MTHHVTWKLPINSDKELWFDLTEFGDSRWEKDVSEELLNELTDINWSTTGNKGLVKDVAAKLAVVMSDISKKIDYPLYNTLHNYLIGIVWEWKIYAEDKYFQQFADCTYFWLE